MALEQDLEQILDGADGKEGELGEEADPAGAAEPAAEPAESIAGSSTRGFDPTVDAEYVRKLTICCVRTCKLCAHQSNEVNPLVHGYYARNARFPTWPWRQGSYSQPQGHACAI